MKEIFEGSRKSILGELEKLSASPDEETYKRESARREAELEARRRYKKIGLAALVSGFLLFGGGLPLRIVAIILLAVGFLLVSASKRVVDEAPKKPDCTLRDLRVAQALGLVRSLPESEERLSLELDIRPFDEPVFLQPHEPDEAHLASHGRDRASRYVQEWLKLSTESAPLFSVFIDSEPTYHGSWEHYGRLIFWPEPDKAHSVPPTIPNGLPHDELPRYQPWPLPEEVRAKLS